VELGGESIARLRRLPRQRGFIPVVCGATESQPDHLIDAELAVAEALEGLHYATEIIEVALDLLDRDTAFTTATRGL